MCACLLEQRKGSTPIPATAVVSPGWSFSRLSVTWVYFSPGHCAGGRPESCCPALSNGVSVGTDVAHRTSNMSCQAAHPRPRPINMKLLDMKSVCGFRLCFFIQLTINTTAHMYNCRWGSPRLALDHASNTRKNRQKAIHLRCIVRCGYANISTGSTLAVPSRCIPANAKISMIVCCGMGCAFCAPQFLRICILPTTLKNPMRECMQGQCHRCRCLPWTDVVKAVASVFMCV